MKPTFFGRYALLIVCTVCFLVPFSMRGARVAVRGMKNEVTDWLPSTFNETQEMKWFWQHFLGERFIVASWEGCTGGPEDQSYRLFLEKLRPEVPPSLRPPSKNPNSANGSVKDENLGIDQIQGEGSGTELADAQSAQSETDSGMPAPMGVSLQTGDQDEENPTRGRGFSGIKLARSQSKFIGDELGLFTGTNEWHNFGGRDEKWLMGSDGNWYFITPNGELFHWEEGDSPIAAWLAKLWRSFAGGQIEGKPIASFSPEDGPWYYANTRRINAQLFNQVTTGPQVLDELTREGRLLADDVEEAKRRLRGVLFGPDGRQTCMILTLSPNGIKNYHFAIGRGVLGKPRGRLFDIAQECGISMENFRLGGPPVDNVAIDEEGSSTLVRLVSLSVLLGVGLSYACFRSISATAIVLFVGGISAVTSLALVYWGNSSLDAILMSMPSLVYVLGISGAVHLVNYYRDHLEEHGPRGAPEIAVSKGWKPAVLCNLTTAIGLISLCTSEIVPIRKFGIFSGIAVLGTCIVLFTFLPAALEIFPQKPRSADRKRRDEQPWYEKYLSSLWDRLALGIIARPNLVTFLCALVIVVVGAGILRINTSIDLLKMFDGRAKILHDYAWLEKNLGKLVPMEIVVKVSPDSMLPSPGESDRTPHRYQLSFLDRMLITDRVQTEIERVFGESGQKIAGQSLSAATFALPTKDRFESYTGRVSVNSALQKHRHELLNSDYLRIDKQDQSELWRISLRIGALQNVDHGTFTSELKCVVEPIFAAYRHRDALLRKLEERGDTGKSRVLLLGAPLVPPKRSITDSPEGDAIASTGVGPSGLHQTEIFASTLRDTLRSSRLDVRYHNPDIDNVPENFADTIAKFDVVLLCSNSTTYDLNLVRANSKWFIDATDHRFVSSDSMQFAAAPAGGGSAGPTSTGPTSTGPVSAVYTGVVPIVYKAQRTLLNSLIESSIWSFVTITPIMMFVARSISAGLLVMLPNVLPVLVIFGAMGWMGINVDLGSMMSASIALGVAVDDTIHFLTWFREALDRFGNRREAILWAYRHCATPTFQAAMISGLGLSIFAFSTFTPTQRFGYLMLTILFAGMVAELIFMPALLAGPLGAVFKPRKQKTGETPHRPSAEELPTNQPEPADRAAEPALSLTRRAPGPHAAGSEPRSKLIVRADGGHISRATE